MIYLVRHGETVMNKKGLIQGHKDSNLSSLGKMQMSSMAQTLNCIPLDDDVTLFSSDLGRAKQSTDILTGVIDTINRISFTERLRERTYGEFDGKKLDDYDGEGNYKGAESRADVHERLISFVEEELDALDKDVIIMGHASSLRVLMCILTGQPWQDKTIGHRLSHGEFAMIDVGCDIVEIVDVVSQRNYR
jgi:broad specificity phosphatase PhoE